MRRPDRGRRTGREPSGGLSSQRRDHCLTPAQPAGSPLWDASRWDTRPGTEVAPVWWTPEHLCSRSPRCRRRDHHYTPEFRRQMVELVRAGRSPEELAKEFEPTAQSIRNWVAQADRDAGRRSDGLTQRRARGAEPAAAREPAARLEREILSKAAAWFARETNTIPPKDSEFVSANQAVYPIATHVPRPGRLPQRLLRVDRSGRRRGVPGAMPR